MIQAKPDTALPGTATDPGRSKENVPAVFVTGGTGYVGTRLVRRLLKNRYRVLVLTRAGSEQKVPAGAEIISADPFDAASFRQFIPRNSIFVQLLGVAHPSPAKAKQFEEIDLRSVKTSADAAKHAGVSHFIYISVAMSPSRLMAAYQAVRHEGEAYCKRQDLNCTFIRPWYVLGPGHWWPVLLFPFYGIAELVPSWRKKARAKALVTINQLLTTLLYAIGTVPPKFTIFEIKDIRKTTG